MMVRYTFGEKGGPLISILSPEVGERKKPQADLALYQNSVLSGRYSVKFFEAVEDDGGAQNLHLSLSQRERIKVRDFFRVARRAPSKLLIKLHPNSRADRDYKIARRGFLDARENDRAIDHVPVLKGMCDLHRQAQRRVAFSDNRNRGCNCRWDVACGICTRQSFGFEDGAKECVRTGWSFYGGNEGGSLEGEPDCETKSAESLPRFQQSFLPPHLNPLPRFGGEVGTGDNVRLSGHCGVAL